MCDQPGPDQQSPSRSPGPRRGPDESAALGLERHLARLVPYQPAWKACFEEECERLRSALGDRIVQIEHIGSTAIEGMDAKPIIDIMVAVPSIADAEVFERALAPLGYVGGQDPEVPDRLYFVKRTPDERSTHHLNITEMGSDFWVKHIRFRDYLRTHPEAREQYNELKRALVGKHAQERRAYTDGKTEFVERILKLASNDICRQESGRGHCLYHRAPAAWEPSHPNPFAPDGTYSRGWGSFCVLDRDDDTFIMGGGSDAPFGAQAGKRVPDLARRLCDFIRYERSHGRQVIVAVPEGIDVKAMIRSAWDATADKRAIRADDPAVVVHSTFQEAWSAIQRDGVSKSTARLRAEGYPSSSSSAETSAVALYQQNEPEEYADYIMFGHVGNPGVECMMASKQCGDFRLDPDAPYTPGVRLYFDLHAIIRDGLGVRDGLHLVKVRNHLSLTPYLLGAVGLEDIAAGGPGKDWTPRLFTQQADRIFEQRRRASANGP